LVKALKDKVALVAGATRGAGRGIAVELGAAGATVYVTGRTTRTQRSEYNRPETIEETAELVTQAGGQGIAVPTDHLDVAQVQALTARIDAHHGRVDILVNDIWGGEHLFEENVPVWEHSLEKGFRLLRLAIDTHIITSHFALPLMIRKPGGLVVELTDGTAEYNATHYRVASFYDLAKASAIRLAWIQAQELRPYQCAAVALTPGWLRSEMMLDGFGVTEANWRDALAKCPGFAISGWGRRRWALQRPIAVQRPTGQGLWLHRPRRLAAGLLSIHPRGSRGRQAGRRQRVQIRRN
jgi:NAD(P)-dependent dehydrogenase (short-subunit alcohol dehydrogenase family)